MRADSSVPLRIDTNSNSVATYKFNGNRADEKARGQKLSSPRAIHLVRERISPWCRSTTKRLLDCASVLTFLPFLVPVLFVVGLAVCLTSAGPVLVLQKRVGRRRHMFTVAQFRTFEHRNNGGQGPAAAGGRQRLTPIGHFLRKWKLDGLPLLWNVLTGDMSLVGPCPELPGHQQTEMKCRPGITGAAALAFGDKESVLEPLSNRNLNDYDRDIVLPAKYRIDQEYVTRATFFSDLGIILRTITRGSDPALMQHALKEVLQDEETPLHERIVVHSRVAAVSHERDLIQEEQLTEA